ncbi:uncharacterized protein LOC115716546 [Cannabis sativa]|uniref:uncharacterized protein LOC115716546 n=1 Tax=Cannabis sativa TaxID=3483 RepID=UPI0029CA168A|nr:uncharacterized protein LOC115716546 [Cannabis sativa]
MGNPKKWDNGLGNVIKDYFSQIFTAKHGDWDEVLNCVNPIVKEEHNRNLLRPIQDQEVKDALFQMHPDKSPEPDGMNPKFFQKYWHIRKKVGKDGYMVLKLDLSKAYDRVDWLFLCAILSRLGFDDKWVWLIFGCLSSVQFHVVSSGYTLGPITPSIGLRQGDPISPYLFLKCAEGFSTLIRSFEDRKLIHGCKVANGAPIVSHMLFANDSFLYCKATEQEVANIQQMLDVFAKASGQQVNFTKSSVFFSTNTTSMRQTICNRMGIREADEKSKYLGLPSTIGRNKIATFSYVVDKVHKRVQTWDNKFLSKAGKEVLIKSVIQALPAYTMNVFLLPVSISTDVVEILVEKQ